LEKILPPANSIETVGREKKKKKKKDEQPIKGRKKVHRALRQSARWTTQEFCKGETKQVGANVTTGTGR